MKVRNWRAKICSSLVAVGLMAPQVALSVDIPLGDSGFEAYAVPSYGYAYSNIYRPVSAWIDDQDSPEGRFEDDGESNWLYDAAYATPNLRPTPRTGNQAMHGLGNYSTQEAPTVFEAGNTYTFSVYAQGDGDAEPQNGGDRAWLYIFNGSQSFSEANSLNFLEFASSEGDFVDRPDGASAELSSNLWQKISVSHTVLAGAPEIGQPVGVGFFGRRDVAFDDASLSVDTTILILEINTSNGHAQIVNETGKPVHFDYYEILSEQESLDPITWSSLQEQDRPDFPAGNGSGNGWEEADGSNTSAIGESVLVGSSQLAAADSVGLGTVYKVGDPQDLVFHYGDLAPASINADFDNDGDVDGRDFLVWQRGVGTMGLNATKSVGNANTDRIVNADDLAIWQEEYGNTSTTLPLTSTLKTGFVRYVPSGFISAVPEPSSILLVGLAGTLISSRRVRVRNSDKERA